MQFIFNCLYLIITYDTCQMTIIEFSIKNYSLNMMYDNLVQVNRRCANDIRPLIQNPHAPTPFKHLHFIHLCIDLYS